MGLMTTSILPSLNRSPKAAPRAGITSANPEAATGGTYSNLRPLSLGPCASRNAHEESSCIRGGSIYDPDFSTSDSWSFPVFDLPRKTTPRKVGNFGRFSDLVMQLRSVSARIMENVHDRM